MDKEKDPKKFEERFLGPGAQEAERGRGLPSALKPPQLHADLRARHHHQGRAVRRHGVDRRPRAELPRRNEERPKLNGNRNQTTSASCADAISYLHAQPVPATATSCPRKRDGPTRRAVVKLIDFGPHHSVHALRSAPPVTANRHRRLPRPPKSSSGSRPTSGSTCSPWGVHGVRDLHRGAALGAGRPSSEGNAPSAVEHRRRETPRTWKRASDDRLGRILMKAIEKDPQHAVTARPCNSKKHFRGLEKQGLLTALPSAPAVHRGFHPYGRDGPQDLIVSVSRHSRNRRRVADLRKRPAASPRHSASHLRGGPASIVSRDGPAERRDAQSMPFHRRAILQPACHVEDNRHLPDPGR